MIHDPKLRYGLRVAIAPWLVFITGLLLGWPLSCVGAVFTSLFILGQKPVPAGYGFSLVVTAYCYMILAWFVTVGLRPYPGAFLLVVILAVTFSYYLLVQSKDILMTVIALFGALLIPLQIKASPETALDLAIWLPNNLLIALLVSWAMFRTLPPAPESTKASAPVPPEFDRASRWLKLCVVVLPLVVFAFVTDNVGAFVLAYMAVQVTQFAASPSYGPAMIKAAVTGNLTGGLLAVLVYEAVVIAPFLPVLVLSLLAVYAYLAKRLLAGEVIASTAMTAFTMICGVSFGSWMDDAEGKIMLHLFQLASCMGYIFIAMRLVDKWLPEITVPEVFDPYL